MVEFKSYRSFLDFTESIRPREPPTCAGVLAYSEVGFPRVNDPVAYMHPAYMHPRYDGAPYLTHS